jgi:alkanesulfonate monooxygenase SsuD/methylene tetrahydromethanopterin reductase-like flavin-dependent oxidoreductase (luciferase family)
MIQFGLNVNPNAGGLPMALRTSLIADSNGLEFVGVQDHPYNPQLYDTLSLITWLAAQTTRVTFLPNVANLPLRPPAMLAKQAATIHALSGGRFVLGLGSGGFGDAATGMGAPQRSVRQSREALGEAIDIMRATWAGQPFSYTGDYYSLTGVQPGPKPAQPMGIWLGVTGPQSAKLLGAKADGWSVSMPYVPPERLKPLQEAITSAAIDAGRDPSAIVRSYNLMGTIESVPQWADLISVLYRDHGMNSFIYWANRDRERQSELFAAQVVPMVRAQLL